jgi:polyisoprenoid-binding protein YceI
MSKTAKIVVAVVAVVVVLGGAGLWYATRDTAPEAANLDAIDVPTGSTPPGSGSTSGTGGSAAAPETADGTWVVVPSDDVFVGYRIDELFAGETISKTAFGRTGAVEGEIVVDGSQVTEATFTADVSELKSDEDRRDGAIGTRGLQTETFPEATFTLTAPIELPSEPVEGQEVTVSATGDLTLHGQTKPVTLELTAKWTGSAITVAGSAPIVLADFGIDVIEIPGFVTIEDHGTLELQLLLQPA